MKSDYVFTSESVTAGHPDKLADQISDALVDSYLTLDPASRVNCECALAKGLVLVATRFASDASVDIPQVVRTVIRESGYTRDDFNAEECSVLTSVVAEPVNLRPVTDEKSLDDGALSKLVADHQATVFGYACRETSLLMPLPIVLAHQLARRIETEARGDLPYLTPDGSIQVGVEYRREMPHRIHSLALVVSQWQAQEVTPKQLEEAMRERVITPAFADAQVQPDRRTRVFVNPGGPGNGGGPNAHAGLTGRKTGADTYGGYARQGTSALSGKDPLRPERVAVYASRYAAKNVVAAELATRCEVQLGYAIGLAGPVSLQVETFGTGTVDDETIRDKLVAAFDFRLGAVIAAFDLRRLPGRHDGNFYRRLASYGQVGRDDLALPWERTDLADKLA